MEFLDRIFLSLQHQISRKSVHWEQRWYTRTDRQTPQQKEVFRNLRDRAWRLNGCWIFQNIYKTEFIFFKSISTVSDCSRQCFIPHKIKEGKNYRQNSGEKTARYRGTACTIFRTLMQLLSVLPSTSTGFGANRRMKNGAERAYVLPGWLVA